MEPRKTLNELAQEASGDRGIRCPKCGGAHCPDVTGDGKPKTEKNTEVVKTMAKGPRFSIRRIRLCRLCGNQFSTYERTVSDQ